MTKQHWLRSIGVGVLVAVITWVGLNLGKMLYADWAFLHAVRINSERAASQPAPPQGK